jgi:aspartate/methionine/tyrosine aminotransferase
LRNPDSAGLSNLPAFAERATLLGADTAFDLLSEVNHLRAQGRDVISFGIGEPDMPTPPHVIAAAKDALDAGLTRYGPTEGLAELRVAIAEHVSRTRAIPVEPDQVIVAPGAKPFIFYALATLVNPGEEVIYPNPGFPTYESVIRWLGARPVPMPLVETNGFGCDRDALAATVTARTKLMILNSPNNPTGAMLDGEELHFIADLAARHDCWVLADEIYSQLAYGIPFASVASLPGMADRSIIMDGFSKSYGMTGWRLGYAVMHRDLARLMARVEMNVESCTYTFGQAAAVTALAGSQDATRAFVAELSERAALIVGLLNEMEGVRCVAPRGAFYAFPNVTGACRRLGLPDAEALADRLLHEVGVAVLPRSCFGPRNPGETDEYLRLSFATSIANIREGVARMARFIECAA